MLLNLHFTVALQEEEEFYTLETFQIIVLTTLQVSQQVLLCDTNSNPVPSQRGGVSPQAGVPSSMLKGEKKCRPIGEAGRI